MAVSRVVDTGEASARKALPRHCGPLAVSAIGSRPVERPGSSVYRSWYPYAPFFGTNQKTCIMAKPTGATVIIWRDLAEEGYTYAEIARKFPEYTVNQIRHYCLGNTGKRLPGPIQESGRWQGRNVWLQGEKSPHAGITRKQALDVLEDWEEGRDRFGHSASYWAEVLGVSPSAIQQLRRGDTWQHLNHPNQRKNREKR